MTSVRFGLLLAALATMGCDRPGSPTNATPLSMTRLREGAASFLTFSGYEQATTLVVRDRDAWQLVWNQAHRNILPMPLLPQIDFSQEMIVVAALGPRPSSGYDVVFTQASEVNGVITVDAEARSPGATCATLTVITSPLDLARLPARSGTVLFHITSSTVLC
jgi:hypothetical protein